MFWYFLRRMGFLIIVLLFTSILIFVITRQLPGDVARVILGREAGEEALQALRTELDLDQPGVLQYINWLTRMVRGDWGISYSTRSEIRPLIMERTKNSLILAVMTLIITIPLSVGLGILAGLNEHKPLDHLIGVGTLIVVGLPEFVTGLVLIDVFAFRLKLLPASSAIRPDAGLIGSLPALILPSLTATLVLLAYVSRMTRSGVIEELKKPYIRTADLKGLPRSTVITHHLLRNALLPTITIIALSFGWLIGGLIVIENVFNYPGLGRLMLFAIDRRDLPLIQAIAMITVMGFAFANLAADLIYAFLNPKIRFG